MNREEDFRSAGPEHLIIKIAFVSERKLPSHLGLTKLFLAESMVTSLVR